MSRSPTFRPPVTHESLQGRAWVYYIRRSGYIKIGTTKNLARRMNALRPEAILALEPGSYKRETYRHRQFEREQQPPELFGGETEWFEPSGRLLRHIAELAERKPPPTLPVKFKEVWKMDNEQEPLDAETTAPIPVVKMNAREKLRYAFRTEVQSRTFEGENAWQGSGRSIAEIMGNRSDGMLSNWWPYWVVIAAIVTAVVAQTVSFWFVPVGVVVMIVINHAAASRVTGRASRRLQERLDAERDV